VVYQITYLMVVLGPQQSSSYLDKVICFPLTKETSPQSLRLTLRLGSVDFGRVRTGIYFLDKKSIYQLIYKTK
jgi:hypothetical protein